MASYRIWDEEDLDYCDLRGCGRWDTLEEAEEARDEIGEELSEENPGDVQFLSILKEELISQKEYVFEEAGEEEEEEEVEEEGNTDTNLGVRR